MTRQARRQGRNKWAHIPAIVAVCGLLWQLFSNALGERQGSDGRVKPSPIMVLET